MQCSRLIMLNLLRDNAIGEHTLGRDGAGKRGAYTVPRRS